GWLPLEGQCFACSPVLCIGGWSNPRGTGFGALLGSVIETPAFSDAAQQLAELARCHIQFRGLVDQRHPVPTGEGLLALRDDLLPCTLGDKHANTSLFLKHPGIHQQAQPLAGGSRIDRMEGSKLVRRRCPLPLWQGAVHNGIRHKLGHLLKQRRGGFLHGTSRYSYSIPSMGPG